MIGLGSRRGGGSVSAIPRNITKPAMGALPAVSSPYTFTEGDWGVRAKASAPVTFAHAYLLNGVSQGAVLSRAADHDDKPIVVRETCTVGGQSAFVDSAPIYTNAPTISGTQTPSLAENNAPGAVVATYTSRAGVTWGLTGTDAASFSIAGGVVTINAAADFEAKASYGFTVTATDSGGTGQRAVTLGITNVLEDGEPTAPIFSSYANGLAGTADGADFRIEYNGDRYLTYKRANASEAVLQSVAPKSAPTMAAMPTTPLLDMHVVNQLYGLRSGAAAPGVSPSLNLFGASSPMKMPWLDRGASSLGWGTNGNPLTFTADQTDHLGGTSAVRVACDGTAFTGCTRTISVPPGRWVLACRAKSNIGDMAVPFGTNGFTGLTNMGLTSEFQEFIIPFHVSAETTRVMTWGRSTAGAAWDITLSDIRLIPGSVAAASPDPTGALLYNGTGVSGTVSASPALAIGGFVGLPAASYRNAVTMAALYRRTAGVERGSGFEALIGQRPITTPNGSGVSTSYGFGSNGYYSGGGYLQSAYGGAVIADMAGLSRGVWGIIVTTAGPSGSAIYVDGIKVASSASPYAGYGAQAFELQQILGNSGVFGMPGEVPSITLWDTQVNDTQAEAIRQTLLSRAAALGLTVTPSQTIYVAEGDSITASGETYARQIGRTFSPFLSGFMFAVGASIWTGQANSIMARQAAVQAKVQELVNAGKTVVFSLLTATNDSDGIQTEAGADTYYAGQIAYLAALKAINPALVKTIYCTQVPRNPGENTSSANYMGVGRPRLLVRARAGVGTDFDALCDFADIDEFKGDWAAISAYYGPSDNLHPNATGQALMRDKMLPVVTALRVPAFSVSTGYFADGDSTTQYSELGTRDSYPAKLRELTGRPTRNFGAAGQTIVWLDANFAASTSRPGGVSRTSLGVNTLVLIAGINDLNYSSASATIEDEMKAAYTSYIGKAIAAGFIVYWGTILPRTGMPGTFQTKWANINNWIRANWLTLGCAGLIDFATVPELSDASNTTYFDADGLHLVPAGNQKIAEKIVASTNPAPAQEVAPVTGGTFVTFDGTNDYIAGSEAASGSGTVVIEHVFEFLTIPTHATARYLYVGSGNNMDLRTSGGIIILGGWTGAPDGAFYYPWKLGVTYTIRVEFDTAGGLGGGKTCRVLVNGLEVFHTTAAVTGNSLTLPWFSSFAHHYLPPSAGRLHAKVRAVRILRNGGTPATTPHFQMVDQNAAAWNDLGSPRLQGSVVDA